MFNSNILNLINSAKNNPQSMYDSMLKSNPQFAKFVEDNKNKSVDQIAKEYGVNPSLLSLFTKR